MSQAPQPGPPTKESMCSHYSSVSLFLSWADFFFFFLIPARTGAARTTRAPPDCDSIITEKAGDSYLVRREPDRFLAEVREVAVVVVRDRKRESPSGGKRELMSELNRTRWSDPL